jgi:hypothetical protein
VYDHQKFNCRSNEDNDIKALMGLFMFTAVFDSGNKNMFSLFSTDSSGCPHILGLFDSVNDLGYKWIKPH